MSVSQDQFQRYVRVQMSGATNMMDTKTVCALAGLERETVLEIMNDYEELETLYGSDAA